jgi:hypothetical protein
VSLGNEISALLGLGGVIELRAELSEVGALCPERGSLSSGPSLGEPFSAMPRDVLGGAA